MNNIQSLGFNLLEKLMGFLPNFIAAIIIFCLGNYLIKLTDRVVKNIMQKRELEPTLANFLSNILFWTLKIILIVTVIAQLGIGTSSFVAILGAAGLAVGLSLQGSLSNFSGGILIILFKPFKVNDVIEAQGVFGTVKEIQIFVTKILTANNQLVFIPNGNLSNGVIINYSAAGFRKADLLFTMSYQTDLKTVKDLILKVMKSNPRVLQNPKPVVIVKQLNENSLILSAKPSIKIVNFNDVCSEILEECQIEFKTAGIDFQPNQFDHAKQ